MSSEPARYTESTSEVSKQDLIKESFEKLIAEGREILARHGWNGSNYASKFPDTAVYYQFRTRSANLVRRTCGEDSDHYHALTEIATNGETSRNSFYFANCVGLLEAAQCDFQDGLLFDMRALITAEILGDFLEQSEELFKSGYHVASASLAGAMLEDTLRKLCNKHHIPIPDSTKLDTLNVKLAGAKVYDKLVQKRITAIADIRNNADHGHFDKVINTDVEDMLKWIRRFTTDYLQ